LHEAEPKHKKREPRVEVEAIAEGICAQSHLQPAKTAKCCRLALTADEILKFWPICVIDHMAMYIQNLW
jgi:hypothetical protein